MEKLTVVELKKQCKSLNISLTKSDGSSKLKKDLIKSLSSVNQPSSIVGGRKRRSRKTSRKRRSRKTSKKCSTKRRSRKVSRRRKGSKKKSSKTRRRRKHVGGATANGPNILNLIKMDLNKLLTLETTIIDLRQEMDTLSLNSDFGHRLGMAIRGLRGAITNIITYLTQLNELNPTHSSRYETMIKMCQDLHTAMNRWGADLDLPRESESKDVTFKRDNTSFYNEQSQNYVVSRLNNILDEDSGVLGVTTYITAKLDQIEIESWKKKTDDNEATYYINPQTDYIIVTILDEATGQNSYYKSQTNEQIVDTILLDKLASLPLNE